MQTKTIGFIGGGRITRIFLEGWSRKQAVPQRIVVSDGNAEVLAKLKAKFPNIETTTGNHTAASQDIVFVAVHPPMIAATAGGIKDSIKRDALLVSLAPKFTLAKLAELLGGFNRLARMIPNAPSVMNLGFNPIVFAPGLSLVDKALLTGLLSPLGECPEVAEEKLEAYALVTAMGPTYFWYQLQALRELAGGFGLSEAEIAPALEHMMGGMSKTLLESGLPPAEVMDLVPVKPLADMEAHVAEQYRTRLPALFQKIKP
jgi:pyrroline-5-carboxylate reductase